MIHNRTDKLDDFIKDIINYSRNARTNLTWEAVVLSELVQACIDDLKYMPQVERIKIKLEIDEKESFILDKGRTQVVLNNLISNSFKYHDFSKLDTWIRISAEVKDGRVILLIQDNGSDIPTERQAKIFDMFYRATEDSQGSGLGLYITKEAVEKMGGTIAVESVYGQGTTFTVSIPVHADHPTPNH
jgi:signal transduction histidine kinase